MLKKILIVIGLAAMLTAGASACGPDQEKEAKRRVTFNDLKNEPPMTEEEILLYIKVLPEFAPIETVNPAAEIDFYKKYNFTKNRFFYLRSKIANASLIVAGRNPDLSSFPESLRPSDAELELIKNHFQELKTATDEFVEVQRNR